MPFVGYAKSRRRFRKGMKDRRQIEGGAADDFQHVCRRGLLLQRFTQFVEQPRVLDGDDRLGGEVLDQLDLLIGEGSNFLAVNVNAADQFSSFSIGTPKMVRTPPTSRQQRHRDRVAA